MPRPVKWSRDAHAIRERAVRSKIETWSRPDLEHLFDIGASSAQTLMKAIGDLQAVGGTHFIERAALVEFLDEMIAAPCVEEGLRLRLSKAEPPPQPKPLRVSLPEDLRLAMLDDLTPNIEIKPGEVRITGGNTVEILEGLALLATVLQNDLDHVASRLEPPPPPREGAGIDQGLRDMLQSLRQAHDS